MAEMGNNTTSALFLGSFNFVALVFLFMFFTSDESSTDEVMLFASGDWAPYSGENLPQQGVATAIVSAVIQHMGHTAETRFMPWPQAESLTQNAEKNHQIRATFPYAKAPNRERNFYFSLPILEVEHALYFNPEITDFNTWLEISLPWPHDNAPDYAELGNEIPAIPLQALQRYDEELAAALRISENAQLVSAEAAEIITRDNHIRINNLIRARLALQRNDVKIVGIEGYEFPQFFAGLFVSPEHTAKTNRQAFQQLINSDEKLVAIEASQVARQILRDEFSYNYLHIYGDTTESVSKTQTLQVATISFNTAVHLMAGKSNPENRRFINRFNEYFLRLKTDGTLAKLEASVSRALQDGQLVKLQPTSADGYIRGYLENPLSPQQPQTEPEYVLISRGTGAAILTWSPSYLFTLTQATPQPGLVKIKITQGPHNGREVYIDGRSIVLP